MQWPKELGQTMISKTLHRKLMIEQQEHTKTGVNSGDPEEYAVPAPHVAPVVLLLLQIRW